MRQNATLSIGNPAIIDKVDAGMGRYFGQVFGGIDGRAFRHAVRSDNIPSPPYNIR